MAQFENFLRNIIKVPLRANTETEGVGTTTTSSTCKNLLFESFETDPLLHTEWRFTAPQAECAVSSQLYKQVREFDLKSFEKEYAVNSLLSELSTRLSTLKHKLVNQKATEAEHLCYSSLIGILNLLFENNVQPYEYFFIDSASTKSFLLRSDKLVFEQINTLLGLLAFYNRQLTEASHTSSDKQKSEWLQCCLEILVEIQTLVQSIEASNNNNNKLLYIEPPQSMSNTVTREIVTATDSASLDMHDFVSLYLGGEENIVARQHLCRAKKSELLYEAFRKKHTEIPQEEAVARLSAVYNGYEAACLVLEKVQTLHCKLYHYCRFMAHYYCCLTHYKIAHFDSSLFLDSLEADQESDEQQELARDVLARLLFIIERAKVMSTQPAVKLLDPILKKRYANLIELINTLTKRVDVQCQKRHLAEKVGLTFKMDPFSIKPREDSLFKLLREEKLTACLQKDETLQRALCLIYALLEQHRTKGLSKAVPTRSVLEEAGEEDHHNAAQCTLSNDARFAVLEERESWLRWFIDQYVQIDHQFVINSDFYDKFQTELTIVQKTKRLHQ
jgi:hypothetical protein